ncbi:hypothetical protein CJ195_16500 [Bacillus sp. UMB0899]|nr:hypothetical protein CJ195_16500 [Bacillus sp. UMB0899]
MKGCIFIKKSLNILLTFLILLGLNYLFSYIFDVGFLDYSFLVGIFGMIVIKFFNSSGGYTSKQLDMQIQGETGIKVDQGEDKVFYPGYAFYTSLAYVILSIIALLVYYREYIDF